MKKVSVALILLICLIQCGCATKFEPANPQVFERNWMLLGVNKEDKSQYFYDPKTLTHSGDITRFDCRMVDTLGYESVGVVEVDCYKNMSRVFNMVKYDKYFRSVGGEPDFPWTYFRPDSIMGVNKSRFCK